MDPALLREREAFKKRALAQPIIENRKKPKKEESTKSKSSKKQITTKDKPAISYKSMKGSSQYKFSVLAKIVKHMKLRHQRGDTHALSLEEILDETNQLDVGPMQRHWLSTEALVNNPKILVSQSNKFQFNPPYNLKDKKSLLRLLDKHDQLGQGGILLEDVQESLPNSEKAIRVIGDQIIQVTRPTDKKVVLFYNDKSLSFSCDEEFQKLWRSIPVESIEDQKIEEYLQKQGISSMQDHGMKSIRAQKRKKGSKRNKTFKKHNDHMADILEDYSQKGQH
ncbi:PREDICTED: general transcription factor IIE subunit 2-like [Priapulus caudatus]|uniref:Transcription initiation factor IIE subunit beta n=1 Tax=Priapulus caudatus TaxID=37621 RepID=A0ABM1E3P4_PRICU|nr:PREDICTED: general transcription factor IIE subunit 2-like [Priapulus caudatus]